MKFLAPKLHVSAYHEAKSQADSAAMADTIPAETAKPIAVKIRKGGIQKRSLAKSILGANRAD